MLASGQPPTFLKDQVWLANGIRVFIIFAGFTLALIAIKVGWARFRSRDYETAFGTVSFGALAITPAISGLYRFDQPLATITTVTYTLGLTAGVVATVFRVTLRWHWWQNLMARRRSRRRAARR